MENYKPSVVNYLKSVTGTGWISLDLIPYLVEFHVGLPSSKPRKDCHTATRSDKLFATIIRFYFSSLATVVLLTLVLTIGVPKLFARSSKLSATTVGLFANSA